MTARILVAAAYVAARVVADRFALAPPALGDGLLAWDGTWYRDIATVGYGGLDREALRFFPGFPLAGRFVGVLLGSEGVALVLIANLASIVLGILVLQLMRAEGCRRAAAGRAVWLMMLFPPAFVLVWGYAEALMLVGALLAFLGLRTRRPWVAAAGGLLAALCRPLGILLAIPAAVEVARTWRGSRGRDRAGGLAAIAGPLAGAALYAGWVWVRDGDPLLPFTVQEELRGRAVNPITRMWDGLVDLVGPERFGQGLHLPFAALFVVLLVLAFRRWPVSYGLYAAAVLALALGAENLNSLERYGLNAFPLVLTLALYTADERAERPVLALCAAGFVSLATLAWLAAYVP
ncbi:hypothetical protein [Rhabdothermincola sediminis]|uniref:hypothetical protein n=1 Tax=Rhabdothermincola sediminis TaxID=2751370 RepID=UPI001AA08C6F|nr:hypothetical protein [Rhabdothermincola sediminis]